MKIANLIGQYILPQSNARVSGPPGPYDFNGNRSIIVATPMRSGTHVMMDVLLNALPAYKKRPLYINLDRIPADEMPALGQGGYLLKTHYPASRNRVAADDLAPVIAQSVVIVVRRSTEDIRKSVQKWLAQEPGQAVLERQLTGLDTEIADFWAFWGQHDVYEVDFADLFDAEKLNRITADIAKMVGPASAGLRPVRLPEKTLWKIYVNKALTRLLGRRAPRVDTTIRAKS